MKAYIRPRSVWIKASAIALIEEIVAGSVRDIRRVRDVELAFDSKCFVDRLEKWKIALSSTGERFERLVVPFAWKLPSG